MARVLWIGAAAEMKTLYMIRHSLTQGNERHLYYGTTDIPLTENGRKLCESLRGAFHLEEGTVFAHTGMRRTEETLRLLFGTSGTRVYPELREMDMGRIEMLSYEDVKDDADFRAWCDDATGNMPMPGGTESVNGYRARVLKGLRVLLADDTAEQLMLVCHGGTVGHGMHMLFGGEKPYFFDWIPKACEGFAVDVEDGIPVRYRKIPDIG